jgi:hypothetical protein
MALSRQIGRETVPLTIHSQKLVIFETCQKGADSVVESRSWKLKLGMHRIQSMSDIQLIKKPNTGYFCAYRYIFS